MVCFASFDLLLPVFEKNRVVIFLGCPSFTFFCHWVQWLTQIQLTLHLELLDLQSQMCVLSFVFVVRFVQGLLAFTIVKNCTLREYFETHSEFVS